MNPLFEAIYEPLNEKALTLLRNIDALIKTHVKSPIQEKVWSKMPFYYYEDHVLIVALFKDHANIVSNPRISEKMKPYTNKIIKYREFLTGYTITPKGMLQIGVDQEIPKILIKIIKETLEDESLEK